MLARKLMTRTVAFTPASLFASSEVGAWYDPSDTSTLWKDTAGTDPVTTAGDLVARIDDKSGNGLHLTQGNSALRPTWNNASGYYFLDFDGSDDYLAYTSAAAIPLPNLAMFVAYSEDSAVANSGLVSLYSSTGNDYERTDAITFNTGDASNLCNLTGSSSSNFALSYAGTGAAPKIVASMVKSATQGDLYINGNGTATATDSSFTAFAATNSSGIVVGARQLGSITGPFLNGRIYGIIIRGATTTTTQREDTEDWLNTKTGAY